MKGRGQDAQSADETKINDKSIKVLWTSLNPVTQPGGNRNTSESC